MTGGVKITMVMTFKPESTDTAVKWIAEMLPDTKTRKGFRNCVIHRGQADPNKVIMIEEWDAISDYEAYIAWRAEKGDMDALGAHLAGAPVADFWNIEDIS